MPRPRKVKEWDIRVTPPDGADLIFPLDTFDQFIACREFGKKLGKKHYHIYCKTTMNDNDIRTYLKTICKVDIVKGNDLYRVKEAHEGTIGYIIKDADVVASKGFTEDQLSEFIQQSKKYRQQKDAERKKNDRQKVNTAVEICNKVVDKMKPKYEYNDVFRKYQDSSCWNKASVAAVVLDEILMLYKSEDEGLAPPRTTVERMIITCMMRLGWSAAVSEYYLPRCLQNSFSS